MPSALDDLFPRVLLVNCHHLEPNHSLSLGQTHTLDSNALNYGSCIPPQVQSVFAGNKYILINIHGQF